MMTSSMMHLKTKQINNRNLTMPASQSDQDVLPSSISKLRKLHRFLSATIVGFFVLSLLFAQMSNVESQQAPPTISQASNRRIVQGYQSSKERLQQGNHVIINNTEPNMREDSRLKRQVLVDNNQAHHQQDNDATDQDQQVSQSSSEALNHHDVPQALEAPHQTPYDQQQQQRGKRTLYACEGKQLEIECQSGEYIQLIRANYGRFSIQICNEHGQLDWRVNCMSSASFQIIASSCQSKQSCQLLASNEIFGDACPGTQKYLEVHYQCIQGSNRTLLEQQQVTPTTLQVVTNNVRGHHYQQQSPQKAPIKPQGNIVIQQATPQQDQASENQAANNFLRSQTPPLAAGARWQSTSTLATVGPQLPPWMLDAVMASGSTSSPQQQPTSGEASTQQCPEQVARHVKWPLTDAGQVVQMPCPQGLAQASSPVDLFAVSLACLPSGQWARHVQAARCQSHWLRNMTQRHEAGDSPLSILGELVQRTRPAASSHWSPWFGSGHSLAAYGIGVSAGQSMASLSEQVERDKQTGSLFGDDLVQIARIIRRLVGDELAELLARIVDDKQRGAFAREAIQLLAELVSNLAHPELHQEAWLDLEATSGPTVSLRDRQRVAGQLVASLEQAAVLLAGALSSSPNGNSSPANRADDFLKVTENVYLAIRGINVPIGPTTELNSTEITFPSPGSTLGTRWMNSEQHFSLNLQASMQVNENEPEVASPQQIAQLKVVFIMLRSLGAQMEPTMTATGNQAATQEQQQVINGGQQLVNSDLISLALVADARRPKVKIDLFSPTELTFRHTNQLQTDTDYGSQAATTTTKSRCAFWDSSISDWLSDGCKLVAGNHTHSTCACNHLTTFALLASSGSQLVQQPANADWQQSSSGNSWQARLPLEGVENELQLSATRTLYLAKLLDGNLFSSWTTSNQAPNSTRPIIYVACLTCLLLLALLLAAAAYCRAHARKLLRSLPSEPAPSLLVASNYNNSNNLLQHVLAPHQNQTRAEMEQQASPPSSYATTTTASDYSAALAASRHKLRHEQLMSSGGEQAGKPEQSLYLGGQQYLPNARRSFLASELELPASLIFQLLCLQVLIVFLVECQNFLRRQQQVFVPSELQMDPLAWSTWLLVALLYYLIGSFHCWLFVRLLRLNGHLLLEQQSLQMRSRTQALAPNNLYGSTAVSGGMGTSQRHHLAHHQDHYGKTKVEMQAKKETILSFLLCNARLASLIEHVGPVLLSATLIYLSLDRGQPINQLAYSTTLGSQLAHWPVALDCAWTLPLAGLLYILPAICLLLGTSALMSLRRLLCGRTCIAPRTHRCQMQHSTASSGDVGNGKHFPARLPSPPMNPYGNSSVSSSSGATVKQDLHFGGAHSLEINSNAAGHWLPTLAGGNNSIQGSRVAQSGLFEHHHQASMPESSTSEQQQLELAVRWKRAKFVCLHLLALSTLHTICWVAFFAHCRQALSSPNSPPIHLIWTFASSNLLLLGLICWAQRRQLRRACHLAGLAGSLTSCCQVAATSSSAHSSTEISPAYYLGASSQHRSGIVSAGKQAIKTSPGHHQHSASSGSLFTISNGRASQYGEQRQQLYGMQQQAHLYQQLAASQQHIYDSANNLSQLSNNNNNDWHHQFQPHHHPGQQQASLTLNRTFVLHQQAGQHLQQTNQMGFNQADRATLHPHLATMARVAVNQQQQQQHQNQLAIQQLQAHQLSVRKNTANRLQGEVEGPLVELTTSSSSSASSSGASSRGCQALPSTTFGPPQQLQHPSIQQQGRQTSNNNNNQQQQLDSTEHRPFSLQQPATINCQTTASFGAASGGHFSDEQQQCAMDNFRSHSRANIVTTLVQQNQIHRQQQQQQQPMMIDGLNRQQQHQQRNNNKQQEDEVCSMANNIYDVANYCVS